MNATMNDAFVGLKPIVFGDPEYFKLRTMERPSGKQPHWVRSSDDVAYEAGLSGPFMNNSRH